MKKLIFLLAVTFAFVLPAMAETDNKVREMANETLQETDNKIREMANETFLAFEDFIAIFGL